MYLDLKDSHEDIEQFLAEHIFELESPEYFYGVDCGEDSLELYHKAKYKILICFLSSGEVRSTSNTFMALNGIIKANMGDEVFIDYAYIPNRKDFDLLVREHIPVWFGNVSHCSAKDYDLMCVSHSIIPEALNLFRCLYYSGIPLSRELRFESDVYPFILYGGAASMEASCLWGSLPQEYGGGHSLVDACIFGFGEDHLDKVVRFLLEHNIGLKKDKESILDLATHEFTYVYDPLAYEYVMNADYPLRIDRIDKKKDWLLDKTRICNTYNTNYPGFVHKVFNLDGENADSADVQIALGCSGEGSCAFCSEGTVAGPFREKDFELVKKDVWETKRRGAMNTVGFYAYNLNYYSKIFELLSYAGQNVSAVSLINMRVDEIANNPDFLYLAKALGQIRNSSAIEGMGDRIRNNFLNKNLTKETLLTAARTVFSQKFVMAKFGMIKTGHETIEDEQAFLEEVREMLEIRKEMGVNTALQFSFTPLVVYDNIPLRYEARITARDSFYGNKTMSVTMDGLRDLKIKYNCHIRSKFNGKGPGTFIEQYIIDGGRAITKVLARVTLDDDLDYGRNFNNVYKESILKWSNLYGIDPTDIFRERDIDEIFWTDSIQIVSERRIKEWHEQHRKHDYSHGYCLKTNSSPGKCYGCGTCPDAEQIKRITKRDLYHMDVNKAISDMANRSPRSYTRVVLKKKKEWSIYAGTAAAHYLTSRFLMERDEWVDAFYAVGKNTTFWSTSNEQKCWSYGLVAFDIEWSSIVRVNQLLEVLDKVNSELHIGKIISVFDVTKDLEISVKGILTYLFTLKGVPLNRVKERIQVFDGNVKLMVKGAGGGAELSKKYDPSVKDGILCVSGSVPDTILLTMSISIVYNPYLVLSSILGLSLEVCRQFPLEVVDGGEDTPIICQTRGCGNYTLASYFQDKVSNKCPICRAKSLLYKRMKGG